MVVVGKCHIFVCFCPGQTCSVLTKRLKVRLAHNPHFNTQNMYFLIIRPEFTHFQSIFCIKTTPSVLKPTTPFEKGQNKEKAAKEIQGHTHAALDFNYG